MRTADLTGLRFGRLVVVRISPKRSSGNVYWHCVCDCGQTREVQRSALVSGASQSCGCLKNELSSRRQKTHGMTQTPTYSSWVSMTGRCTNPNLREWPHYGGRGITVCSQWRNFEGFLRDMGERPLGTSLDRIDNERSYEPGNCRWATPKEQSRNKRTSRMLTYRGVTKTITDWAEEMGVDRATLNHRVMVAGWPLEVAFSRQPHPGLVP